MSVIGLTLTPACNLLVAILMAEFVLGVTRLLLSEFEPNEGVKDPVPGVTGMLGGTGGDELNASFVDIFHKKDIFGCFNLFFCFSKPYNVIDFDINICLSVLYCRCKAAISRR